MLDDSFRLLFTYRWEIPRQAAFLPRSQFRRGTCFVCGSEGHWRNNYPNLISSGRSDKSTRWCLWFWKVFRFFCLKLAPSGNTLVFWSNSIRASDFIINTIVEGYRIPFLNCQIILLFPIDLRPSSLKILLTRWSQSYLSIVVLRKFLILPSLSILYTWCSSPVGNAGLFWFFRI